MSSYSLPSGSVNPYMPATNVQNPSAPAASAADSTTPSAGTTPPGNQAWSGSSLNPADMASLQSALSQLLNMLQSLATQVMGAFGGGQTQTPADAGASAIPSPSEAGAAASNPASTGDASGAGAGAGADSPATGADAGTSPPATPDNANTGSCHKGKHQGKSSHTDNKNKSLGADTNGASGAKGVNGATGANGGAGAATSPADKGSMPSPSGEKNLDRWDAQIAAAAKSTGLPANYIKATLWAESRGNPNDPSQNPDGKHSDLGVMQISDYTYGDVMKSQSNAPRGLKAGNPADNIMMGAWELKDKLDHAKGDFKKTSEAYRGVGDGKDSQYAGWVQTYSDELNAGKKLSDF